MQGIKSVFGVTILPHLSRHQLLKALAIEETRLVGCSWSLATRESISGPQALEERGSSWAYTLISPTTTMESTDWEQYMWLHVIWVQSHVMDVPFASPTCIYMAWIKIIWPLWNFYVFSVLIKSITFNTTSDYVRLSSIFYLPVWLYGWCNQYSRVPVKPRS